MAVEIMTHTLSGGGIAPPQAYLTLDDSPSGGTRDLVDFLHARSVPAVFFCRGDRLAEHEDAAFYALERGFPLANHAFSHRPAGEIGVAAMEEEIVRTQFHIDSLYERAGKPAPLRAFRFPYLDRGDGVRIERDFEVYLGAIARGEDPLPVEKQAPSVRALQDFLKAQGFVQPFEGITHPLYGMPAFRTAADSLTTFTAGDWMMAARHQGQWPWKSLDDLKARIDSDPWLQESGTRHVVLFHDDPEFQKTTLALIAHMYQKGVVFLDI